MIVIPGDLDYRYDRRVDPDFLDLFDARGAFRTLTEYACKARYPVDLQFRRNPKTAAQHASLYVGLTTVLDVHWKPGAVKLAAHPTFQPSGFQAAWMSWTAISVAAAQADAVDGYLDAVIPKAAAGRAAVEGAPTITWAPAQAIVYARLFNIWLQHDPDAAEILSGMIEQRKRLNLIKSQASVLPSRPSVIPIVAVQRGVSQELRGRLFTVRRHLADQGIDEASQLRVYEVTLAGRLLPANGSR